jgi:hypothetical protein
MLYAEIRFSLSDTTGKRRCRLYRYSKNTIISLEGQTLMYSIQQQYNLIPGNYAKEMAAVSVWPHLKSIAVDISTYLWRGIVTLFQGGRRLLRKKTIKGRNTQPLTPAGSV